ncbi:hypothetical protein BAU15_02485 [Enterococcus sp. JM4C]|uniref:hypothetical protein n=1 Tax=Candidatus Enterococcus huntleyi TaxID=1857217 RepID=UPI001379F1ED|nr:hypothetical protein [Enterococcus sp. JM4C]KAF1299530.1 hypothetical protein BAU15_02485 [Enterococcus sp. JM4C]
MIIFLSFCLILLVQWYFRESDLLTRWKFRWVLLGCILGILFSVPISILINSEYPTIVATVILGTTLQIKYMSQFRKGF